MTGDEKRRSLTYAFCQTRLCEDCPFPRQFAERHNIPRVTCYDIEIESMPNISKVVNLWCSKYDTSDDKLQQVLGRYKALDLFNEMTGGGTDWV